MKMRFLSLFSGIGGFDLGLERAGMECAGQVEYNPFCQRVLKHHWPHVKIMGDIHDVTESNFGAVDLICGGFPCQPFSLAGKRKGTADDRYLWPEMLRVIKEYRPAWVLGENVIGIVNMELDNVLSDLEAEGYETETHIIPACAVDAKHERKRVWIVAYATNARVKSMRGRENQILVSDSNCPGLGERRWPESIQQELDTTQCAGEDVSDAVNDGHDREKGNEAKQGGDKSNNGISERGNTWEPEPGLGRVAHGIPGRVDRLRSLGNAVVPQVVEVIGRSIVGSHLLHTRGNP